MINMEKVKDQKVCILQYNYVLFWYCIVRFKYSK